MALSNWDLLCIGPNGVVPNGIFKDSDKNNMVFIRKNSVYIQKHNTDDEFLENHISMLYGSVYVNGITVTVKRVPSQQAVLLFAYDHTRDVNNWMIGIGCYGYEDNCDKCEILRNFFGIKKDDWEYYNYATQYKSDSNDEDYILLCFRNTPTPEVKEYVLPSKGNEHLKLGVEWVGVNQETYNELISFVEDILTKNKYSDAFEKWFNNLKNGEIPVKRINQGDLYFVNTGLDDVKNHLTDIGKGGDPILKSLI